MKIETSKREESGAWSQQETVTSASWTISPFIKDKKVEEVRVYILNEHKRMVVLSFKDAEEVRAFAEKLLGAFS